ncbi:MAG: 4-hydroxy-tetrahydrodipicolinate reductase, partial [Clostridiales bacterium]|nr:4-hydroxy-tetrahydrodipicolinate reductase [Clostridiales bacterium]
MTKIFMNGCCGRMGRAIYEITKNGSDCTIVAGGDISDNTDGLDFPVFKDPSACDVDYDVIIDFSNAKAVPAIVRTAVAKKKPIVICTTAIDDETLALIDDASSVVPVFKSANMSYGMNVVFELVAQATKALYPGFDIEVVEAHHNRKLDAPSGTAMTIADTIRDNISEEMELVYDRHDRSRKRSKNEIGMSAIRGGNIVGEHEVYFISDEEIVKISHSAMTRAVFGSGALTAASFLKDKKPGYYSMKDIVA